jgi:hypothetical protein
MSTTFTHKFKSEAFNGNVHFPTGVFIGGKFSAGAKGTSIE